MVARRGSCLDFIAANRFRAAGQNIAVFGAVFRNDAIADPVEVARRAGFHQAIKDVFVNAHTWIFLRAGTTSAHKIQYSPQVISKAKGLRGRVRLSNAADPTGRRDAHVCSYWEAMYQSSPPLKSYACFGKTSGKLGSKSSRIPNKVARTAGFPSIANSSAAISSSTDLICSSMLKKAVSDSVMVRSA